MTEKWIRLAQMPYDYFMLYLYILVHGILHGVFVVYYKVLWWRKEYLICYGWVGRKDC